MNIEDEIHKHTQTSTGESEWLALVGNAWPEEA